MYIEDKSTGLEGPGRIGRVTFSQTGKSIYYAGRTFQSLNGQGFKANYFDVQTGAEFWISGCKIRGGDRLYGGIIEIDEDFLPRNPAIPWCAESFRPDGSIGDW